MNRKLLVLDLDETLIYGSEEALPRPADFNILGRFDIYRRPHLDEFLAHCFREFRVGVWTSATASYASPIVERIVTGPGKLEFLWDRERCTQRFDRELHEHYWVKNLGKLKKKGYGLESILVVDDSPEMLQQNYGNYIRVSKYEGQESDDELLHLVAFLDTLRDLPDVRAVEKRGWRRKIVRPPF